MTQPARFPAVAFGCLSLAILGFLGYRALVAPDVQFLAAASGAPWMVHPNPVPGYREAVFTRAFELPIATVSYPVRITAMRECEVTVNGHALPKVVEENWKRAVDYDLGPLLTQGHNEIRILVTTPQAPPALRVEGPEAVRSDQGWRVRLPPDSDTERDAVIADGGEDYLANTPNSLRSSPHFVAFAWVLAAYGLFIAYAAVPARRKPRGASGPSDATTEEDRRASSHRVRVFGLALFAVVAAVQLRNASVYPSEAGFDSRQHADYVQFVAEQHTVPDASNGWEMSQPPLYYAIGAVLFNAFGGAASPGPSLRALQFLTAVCSVAALLPTWWLLALLCPGCGRMRVLGFAVAALLPMTLYLGPQINNEPLAAFVIGTAMFLAARQALRGDLRWRDAICVGAACGAGLLSKYTGVFACSSVLCLAGLRVVAGGPRQKRNPEHSGLRPRLRQLGWVTLLVAIVVVMSGWLYAHNIGKFGTPFIGAWDIRSGFNIVQPPGYRTPAFYARFGSVFWQELGSTRFSSFWDGMYGSMWADTHGVFLKRGAAELQTMSSVVLWLALLPTAAILLGFLQALAHLLTREWDHPYLILVVTTVLTVASMISFTLEHPWYSTLKAHWGLSLVPCAGVFAALGLETMCRKLGRLRWILYANLASLGGLVLHLFWYRGA